MSRGSKDRFEGVVETGPLGPDVPDGMPWLGEATRLHDTDGRPGWGSPSRRLRLMDWVDRHTLPNLPWCGLFVGHCLRTAYPNVPLPWLYVRARPWRRWGVSATPQIGAVLVFWLRWPSSPFGHVGFYWAEDDESYHVLGGNQFETILVERFPKDRLIDCRWPVGVEAPGRTRTAHPRRARPFEHADEIQFGG